MSDNNIDIMREVRDGARSYYIIEPILKFPIDFYKPKNAHEEKTLEFAKYVQEHGFCFENCISKKQLLRMLIETTAEQDDIEKGALNCYAFLDARIHREAIAKFYTYGADAMILEHENVIFEENMHHCCAHVDPKKLDVFIYHFNKDDCEVSKTLAEENNVEEVASIVLFYKDDPRWSLLMFDSPKVMNSSGKGFRESSHWCVTGNYKVSEFPISLGSRVVSSRRWLAVRLGE